MGGALESGGMVGALVRRLGVGDEGAGGAEGMVNGGIGSVSVIRVPAVGGPRQQVGKDMGGIHWQCQSHKRKPETKNR